MKPLFLFSSYCLSSLFSLTFFSSLRLTDRELRNDLKTRQLFDESAPVLQKSCPFFARMFRTFWRVWSGEKEK